MGSARDEGRDATRHDDEVHRITDAQTPLSDDISRRSRRYLLQMTIRTVCFLLAVVVSGPMRWVFLAGAVLLPWVAVLLANAGREIDYGTMEAATPEPPAQLTSGHEHDPPTPPAHPR